VRRECPSGSIYKREEDGIVLIDQDKCRGWRMCVSGCPYKKIYYNWKSGKAEKCIFCYPRIEAGQPTVCSETCVGRIRYLGVLLYDADRIQEAASVEHDKDLYQAQLDIFLDPNDPKVIAQARLDGIPDNWMDAARNSPVYKMAVDWKVALPLHPEYRTLPMVWYVPPLSPITAAANAGQWAPTARSRRQPAAHPGQVPGQPADGRRHRAGGPGAGAHAGHARLPAQPSMWTAGQPRRHRPGEAEREPGGGDVPRDGHCQLRRPLRHPDHAPRVRRERLQRARRLRLQLRQRLQRRHTETSLFGSEKKRTIPIKADGLSMSFFQPFQRRHQDAAGAGAPAELPRRRAARHLPEMRAALHDERRSAAERWPNWTR
jgi:nitrate reductase beta subunit